MNCIHRRECVDADEHRRRTAEDLLFLSCARGVMVGFGLGVVLVFVVGMMI